MSGQAKPAALQAFEDNMADAHQLVKLVEGFTNRRANRMRKELRAKVGDALGVSQRQQEGLDCLESSDVFLVFLPDSRLGRSDFDDGRPLLRQALVAACAATETYLADKVMEKVGPLIQKSDALTPRLRELPLTLGDLLHIDENYERETWGIRRYVVEPAVRQAASTAPSQVGALLSMLGVQSWARQLDAIRGASRGDTESTLDRITKRRNKIAHEADRIGRSKRAHLSVGEVRDDLAALESVVHAIEHLLGASTATRAPTALRRAAGAADRGQRHRLG